MRRLRPRACRLRQDRRGVTMVEFGLVAPMLVLVLLVLFDFAYRTYAKSMLEGTLHAAARMATIGDKTPTQVDDFVKGELKLFSQNYPPDIVRKSYYQFSGVNKDESYVDAGNPPNGKYDKGECFIDENNNKKYDYAATAGSTGGGGSDDIVFYTVTLRFARLFPLGRMLGWSNEETVSVNTVLRNQPYGSQAQLPTCITES